jgi:hypothetical protein
MPTPKTFQSFEKLASRVREQLAKQAASGDQTGNPKGNMPTEKDPSCTGTVSIPSDPDGDSAKKKNLPENPVNEDGTSDVLTNLPGQVGSGGFGQIPGSDATINGDAKDRAATSSTVSLDKIAGISERAKKAAANVLNILKQQTAPEKAANSSTEGNVPKEKDPAETAVPAEKKPVIEGVPNSDNENKDKKAADALPASGSPEFFAKLASSMEAIRAICEIEGGMKMVEDLVTKAAGIDTARALLDDITIGYAGAVKAAAEQYQSDMAKAAAIEEIESTFEQLTAGATETEKAAMIKLADTLIPAIDRLPTDVEKAAMMMGAQDQAAMADAGALGDPAAEGAAVPEEAPLPPEEGLPGGAEGEALPIEQIAQLLAAMVEAGELQQEEAEGLLTELAGAVGGGAADPAADPAAAEAVADPAAAGAIPPEVVAEAAAEGESPAAEMTEPEKAAAALIASVK